jgi:Protein of unknown function (DUF2934)
MKSAAEAREERIRERAYHIWEASGRPPGRDEEFWHRACEMLAADDGPPTSASQRRQRKKTQPAKQARRRSRQTSPSAAAAVLASPTV